MGMIMITRHAEAIGLTPKGTTQQLTEMVEKFHLPITPSEIDKEQLYQAITHDKKPVGNN